MAEKKTRLVILISDGILENIIADQALDLGVLKVDVDENAEDEVIYRLESIEVNPQAVEDKFRDAEELWREEKAGNGRAREPEG